MSNVRRAFEGRFLYAAALVVLAIAGLELVRGAGYGEGYIPPPLLPLLVASTAFGAVLLWKPHWVVRGADKAIFTPREQEKNKIFLGLSAVATAVMLALWIRQLL